MTEPDLYAPFNTTDPALIHANLPTVDQARTAYRKQKIYRPCLGQFYYVDAGQLFACPLAIIALARGIALTDNADQRVADYWATQLGYWNASWCFHALDGGSQSPDMTHDQQTAFNRGLELRRAFKT